MLYHKYTHTIGITSLYSNVLKIFYFYFPGYCLGIVTYHINLNEESDTKYSEKLMTQLTKVKELIEKFPRTNSEDHDILGMAETVRAQYRKACALLKISSANPYNAGVSF